MRRSAAHAMRDENHGAVVEALEADGYGVVDLSTAGGGIPDLLVGFFGASVLVEVKTLGSRRKDGSPRKRGRLQAKTDEKQQDFAERWPGPRFEVVSPAQARQMLGLYRRLLSIEFSYEPRLTDDFTGGRFSLGRQL